MTTQKASSDAQTTKNILFAYYWERIYTLISDAGRNNSFGVWEYFYLFCHAHTSFKSWSTPLHREDSCLKKLFLKFCRNFVKSVSTSEKSVMRDNNNSGWLQYLTWRVSTSFEKQNVCKSNTQGNGHHSSSAVFRILYDLKHIKSLH